MVRKGDQVLIFNPTNLEFHLKQGVVEDILSSKFVQNIRVRLPNGKCGMFNKVELDAMQHFQPKKGDQMSKIAYYLQCADDLLNWEEVDKYTWDSYEYALGPDDKARYTGNKLFVENETHVTIEASGLSHREMAVIMRFCGIRGTEVPGSVPGGFIKRPEFVKFAKGKRAWLHKMNGEDFVARRGRASHVSEEAVAKEIAHGEPGEVRRTPFGQNGQT